MPDHNDTPDPKLVEAHVEALMGWTGINKIRKAEERLDDARTPRDVALWRAVLEGLWQRGVR